MGSGLFKISQIHQTGADVTATGLGGGCHPQWLLGPFLSL